MVGCRYFPPGRRLLSQTKRSLPLADTNLYCLVTEHTGVSSLAKATMQWCSARTQTRNLWIASPLHHLCVGKGVCVCICTAEFSTYLRYTRQLDFFETPDYTYVRGLFTGLMAANGWQCDWEFDWAARHTVCSLFAAVLCCVATVMTSVNDVLNDWMFSVASLCTVCCWYISILAQHVEMHVAFISWAWRLSVRL